jgi:hypothetical protein
MNMVELLLQTQKETDDDRIRYQPADDLSVWRVADQRLPELHR